jgi:peptidyl-prolyl cis-trans isomerase C
VATRYPLRKFFSEPLLHFLLLGGLLFALFEFVGKEDDVNNDNVIAVSRDSLADFLALRSKTLGAAAAEQQFENLSAGELSQLVDEFVRQESLYREAKSMRLDEKDVGVRRRLVGQVEFINQGVVGSSISLSDAELRQYLKQNEQRYVQPAAITFTHVFFNSDRRGDDDAVQQAKATLDLLNGGQSGLTVPFHKAPAYGDRFLYHQNYVDDEAEEVASHFGGKMQRQLFALTPNVDVWRGPFRSDYGYHLVLVTKQTESHLPEFEQLLRRLEQDAFAQRMDQELRKLERGVIESYQVVLDDALNKRLDTSTDTRQ